MPIVSLRDAKTGLSSYVDDAIRGEYITITRHGKPVAALVSLAAAEIAQRAQRPRRSSFLSYLKTFPGGEFDRNTSPSREVDL
ncbi:type II toxin-antitoxin system Phd/YefM family antitoxin [Tianweitania populi]|uniref:Antitoxin n=1 Tax=Tianweitania populi TaxID=1607949 RepID=A0A8J3DXN3_9HYPH|nr:type II toxin-antitoxin system Phd/YefM family antitoxin [Tianweitania populi]GHD21027.1 antitoxin [Tianweitania populi]